MRPSRYTCQHSFLQPGDGWMFVKTFDAGRKRLMKCRLCGGNRVEHLTKWQTWQPLEQLVFTFGEAE